MFNAKSIVFIIVLCLTNSLAEAKNLLVTEQASNAVSSCLQSSSPNEDMRSNLNFCSQYALNEARLSLHRMKEIIEEMQSTTSGFLGIPQMQSKEVLTADLIKLAKDSKALPSQLGQIALLSEKKGLALGASMSTRIYNLLDQLQALIGGSAGFGGEDLAKKVGLSDSSIVITYYCSEGNTTTLLHHMQEAMSAITQLAVYISLVEDGYVASSLKEDYADGKGLVNYAAPSYTLNGEEFGKTPYFNGVFSVFP